MVRKCRICGYRFKSRDEAICPECFTAREDDISCERYSANEHSHTARSYSSGLRDTGESFVQQELKEERRNAFARENFGARANAGLDLSDFNRRNDQSRFVRDDYNYDLSREYRPITSQSYPDQQRQQSSTDNRVAQLYQQSTQPQQTAYQRFTAQQQRKAAASAPTGFTPAGQVFAQRNAMRTMQTGPYTNGGKKKNSAAAFVFLVFFIIVFVAAVAVNSIEEQSNNNRKSNVPVTTTRSKTTTTTTARTKKTTTQGTTSKLEKEVKAVNSSLGHYKAEITDAVFETKNKADIADKSLLGASTDFTKEKEPWEIVTLTIELSTTDKALADPKKTTITSTTMQCLEKATATTTMSYSVGSLNEDVDLSGGKVTTTVTLLAHKNAKVIYFNIYLKNSGVTETCRFTINRD